MAIRKLRVRLGEILLRVAPLSLEQLKMALILQEQQFPSRPLGEILLEKDYIAKEDLEAALGIQQGYPYICVANHKIEPEIVKKIPTDLMWKFTFIPLDLAGNVLTIALACPLHKSAIAEELKDYKVRIFVSTPKEIKEALRDYCG